MIYYTVEIKTRQELRPSISAMILRSTDTALLEKTMVECTKLEASDGDPLAVLPLWKKIGDKNQTEIVFKFKRNLLGLVHRILYKLYTFLLDNADEEEYIEKYGVTRR